MIRKAAETDRASLAKLAAKLWGNHSEEELSAEISGLLLLTSAAFFLAEEDRQPVEVAQCQLRHDYVDGADSSPAGYLENIFTEEAVRRKGIAAALLVRYESWAKEKSCTEFASDCELLNEVGIRFHKTLGFRKQTASSASEKSDKKPAHRRFFPMRRFFLFCFRC